MNRFIDIHTHKLRADRQDLIQILSVMVTSRAEIPKHELFSVAIHPYQVSRIEINWIDQLANVARNERCVAIGETGLDMREEYRGSIKQQIASFEEHIFLSNKLQKPLIIHSVKSLPQTLKLLDKAQEPFIFHGFNGSPDAAQMIIERSGYISFGHKIITDKALSERIASIEIEKIFLETDDNDFTIEEIYSAFSKLKGIEIEEIKAIIENNFNKIFKIAR